MRYEVRALHSAYRPKYEVVDTTQPPETEMVAIFSDVQYDGTALKRAKELAEELNAPVV